MNIVILEIRKPKVMPMYNEVKRFVRGILPKRMLFRLEPMLRSVYGQFYKGQNFRCNLCGAGLSKFVELSDGDKLCPACGSLSRSRRLWDLVNSGFIKPGVHILDFSPSRSIYRALKKMSGIEYICTDISGDFLSDYQYDITKLVVDDRHFDLILCYNILEHIDDDAKAMRELWRVLKPDGTCLIQTPFRSGDIYEDSSIISEEDRLWHFGQSDHVRIYSVEGPMDRLIKSGFRVEVRRFAEKPDNPHGFGIDENVLVCYKE